MKIYEGYSRTVLTREYHRLSVERYCDRDLDFVFFDLPFCSKINHHHKWMKLYYILWQFAVLPYAAAIVLRRRITVIHHITYNTLDFPGLLWIIPYINFVWGPVGGGQVPPSSLRAYYGKDWFRQVRRRFVKRMSWANPILRLALSRAKLVMAANTDTRLILGSLIPNPTHLRLLLETAVHAVAAPKVLQGAPLRIIWVGRFEARKAPRLAVEIARAIEKVAPGQYKLRMIGEGDLWNEIRFSTINDVNIIVSPAVSFSEMQNLYKQADVLLFTSLQDTSGNVILECLAQGLPVLSLDHQGAADILETGGGIRVYPGNRQQVIEDFCSGLLKLADCDVYAALSQEAVLNVSSNYLWSQKGAYFKRIYAELIGDRLETR